MMRIWLQSVGPVLIRLEELEAMSHASMTDKGNGGQFQGAAGRAMLIYGVATAMPRELVVPIPLASVQLRIGPTHRSLVRCAM